MSSLLLLFLSSFKSVLYLSGGMCLCHFRRIIKCNRFGTLVCLIGLYFVGGVF